MTDERAGPSGDHVAAAADENSEIGDILFIFRLLDDINRHIILRTNANNEIDSLSNLEIQHLINERITKNPRFSRDQEFTNQRIVHFILYLNTEMENCSWVKTDPSLNLGQHLRGTPMTINTYNKLVDILNLKSYMIETIMSTPYCFNRDLVDIILKRIKHMDGFSQLIETESVVIALFKSIKRVPIEPDLEGPLIMHLNEAMMVFSLDNLPNDIKRLNVDDDKKDITRYKGCRVVSIFKILNEIIRFISTPDTSIQYPLYTLQSIRNVDPSITSNANVLFKKLLNMIMQRCVQMCDFSIETWLSWYEVEIIEEDTNLQACIGHLCYDLCTFIDNGCVNETSIVEYRQLLSNISLKRVDFTNVNIKDVRCMAVQLERCPKYHINDWIKKMVEIHEVFVDSRAIDLFYHNIESIDFNCFKCIIDHCIDYYKSGGMLNAAMSRVINDGIRHLDMVDKMSFIEHINVNYADNTFNFTKEFEEDFRYIVHNEFNPRLDQAELMSKMIWLILQQPRKVFHLLLKQYIISNYGLPTKSFTDEQKGLLHVVMVDMHLQMDTCYIYYEYSSWLDFNSELPLEHRNKLNAWIFGATRALNLIKPKLFLTNVMVPLLNPSPKYEHMLFLIELTKFFLAECQLTTLPDIDVWDNLLIQLAKVMDDARWSMENFENVRVRLCERIIVTLQPLLAYSSYIVNPNDLDSIKQELSGLHLMTRCHFIRLWSAGYITIDGMDEQFIMTIQSQSHITYANLNRSSTQRAQEEFIFSIANFMPKFTLHEMRSFLANYLHSTKVENIVEASYFLVDCVMNALMRIIVYLKTATQNEPDSHIRALKYLDNTITLFFDAANVSKMSCIYDKEVDVNTAFNSITKIIMVMKQLDTDYQEPLMVVLRRIISAICLRLDAESISKLLTIIASIKTENSKVMMKETVDALIKQLNTKPTNPPIQGLS